MSTAPGLSSGKRTDEKAIEQWQTQKRRRRKKQKDQPISSTVAGGSNGQAHECASHADQVASALLSSYADNYTDTL